MIAKLTEEIDKAKREKRLEKSIGVLALAAAIFACASVISFDFIIGLTGKALPFKGLKATVGLSYVALPLIAFLTVFLGGLFLGFVTQLIMTTLGGSGGYFEGLTSLAYPLLPASIGAIIAAAVIYIPVIGPIIVFIALAIFFALAYAGIYRAIREFFDVDMITAFVGVAVLTAIVVTAGAMAQVLVGKTLIPLKP